VLQMKFMLSMYRVPQFFVASLSVVLALLAGCSSMPGGSSGSLPGNPPTSAPLFERPSAGAAALRDASIALERGEYGRAETKINESFKLGLSNTPDLVKGHKTQAFVYCVTARTAFCEKSFEAAFNIDRKFNLTATERQQPVWGPVFAKVQRRYAS
jgi:hypothetical protein